MPASRNFLIEGVDPSLLACLPLPTLLQMFRTSTPSSDLGWVIISETVPDTLAYPELIRFLWLKVSTGALKFYDGSSWEQVNILTVLADGTITLAKLDGTEGSPRQVPRINVGGTAYELVNPTALFNTGEIPLSLLAAATSGDVLFYSSGAWGTTNLDTFVRVIINDNPLPSENLYGLGAYVLAGQIPYFPTVPGFVDFAYAEDVVRVNSLLTTKLKFAAGSNGKYAKVNAGATDFDYVDPPTVGITCATLVDTGVSGYAAQAIVATTLTVLRLAVESAQSWCTVASNAFTLAIGTYLVHAVVPVTELSTSDKGYVALTTGATVLKTANYGSTDNDMNQITLMLPLTVTVPTTYNLKIYAAAGTPTIGSMGSIASIPEVYTQVSIIKLT